MSLVCAFLVVARHAGFDGVPGSVPWWMYRLACFGVCNIAVPFFFIASGYFLANHFEESGWWKREVAKRLRSLLIPMGFWWVILLLWGTPFSIVANKLAGRSLMEALPFADGRIPGIGILWYLRTLFVFVLASPLIAFLIRRFGKMWLFTSFVGCLGFNLMKFDSALYDFIASLTFCLGLFYFSLGCYFRMYGIPTFVLSRNRIGLIASIGGGLVVLSTYSVDCYAVSYTLQELFIPCVLLTFWHLMRNVSFSSRFSACSFPVYLMHYGWLIPVGIIAKRIPFLDSFSLFLIRWVTAFALSVVCTLFMRRYIPRISRILFGGRS